MISSILRPVGSTFVLIGFVLLVFGVLGCVDRFTADLDPPSPRPLVVDGSITSGSGPHSVILSLAAAFEQSAEGATDRVDNAHVSIVDQTTGARVRLHETLRGRYETEEGELTGEPGHTYRLEITLPDGREYRSEPAQMPEPLPLDSTYTAYDTAPAPRIKVLAAADDPEDTANYYRWSVRVTRQYALQSGTPPYFCWVPEDGITDQVPLLDDRLINGGHIRNQEVYTLPPGLLASRLNQVDVRQLTITEDAHEFWSKVEEQVEDVGDPFSAPPGPIQGNIVPVQDSVDRALGYFEVAGATEYSTVCFRQGDFEGAPRLTPYDGPCPQGGLPEPPSYWTCSVHGS